MLQGGPGNKRGRQLRLPGAYTLNPKGEPHSAFIGVETINIIVYAGEPDELKEIGDVDCTESKEFAAPY